MFFKINAGHAAVDNGAIYPLDKLFAIAKAAGQEVIKGESYGDDYLRVPKDKGEREAIEALLNENKLIWDIVPKLPQHLAWME